MESRSFATAIASRVHAAVLRCSQLSLTPRLPLFVVAFSVCAVGGAISLRTGSLDEQPLRLELKPTRTEILCKFQIQAGFRNRSDREMTVDPPFEMSNFEVEVTPAGDDTWESLTICTGSWMSTGNLTLAPGECSLEDLEFELRPGKYHVRCNYERANDPQFTWTGKATSPVVEFTLPAIESERTNLPPPRVVEPGSYPNQELGLELGCTVGPIVREVQFAIAIHNTSDRAIHVLRPLRGNNYEIEIVAEGEDSWRTLDTKTSVTSTPSEIPPGDCWIENEEYEIEPGRYRARCRYESKQDMGVSWIGTKQSPLVSFEVPVVEAPPAEDDEEQEKCWSSEAWDANARWHASWH